MPENRRRNTPSAFVVPDLGQCLARARVGDVRAFELLLKRISPGIEASLVRFLHSDADAASAALQDAWSFASRRLNQFESATHLICWLRRVAKFRAISDFRKRHGTVTTSWQERFEDDPGPPPPAVTDAERDPELGAALRKAIANLPDTYRGIATLHFVYGQPSLDTSPPPSISMANPSRGPQSRSAGAKAARLEPPVVPATAVPAAAHRGRLPVPRECAPFYRSTYTNPWSSSRHCRGCQG